MCTFLLQNGALWEMGVVHCGICTTGLLQHSSMTPYDVTGPQTYYHCSPYAFLRQYRGVIVRHGEIPGTKYVVGKLLHRSTGRHQAGFVATDGAEIYHKWRHHIAVTSHELPGVSYQVVWLFGQKLCQNNNKDNFKAPLALTEENSVVIGGFPSQMASGAAMRVSCRNWSLQNSKISVRKWVTHWGRVAHICATKSSHQTIAHCLSPSHYLNQCWRVSFGHP